MTIVNFVIFATLVFQCISMFMMPPYHYSIDYLAKLNSTYDEYQLSTGQLIHKFCLKTECKYSGLTIHCKWTSSCCFNNLKDNYKPIIDQPLYGQCENILIENNANKTVFIINKCPNYYGNSTIQNLCELKSITATDRSNSDLYSAVVDVHYNIFQNKYCAICHGVTVFKMTSPIRFCNQDDKLVINNASLTMEERLNYYNMKCTKILLKNMLNGSPIYADNLHQSKYELALRKCNTTRINEIVNEANIFTEEAFYRYLCLISDGHTNKLTDNLFCDVKLKEPKIICTDDSFTTPFGNGPEDFKIPSFATLIDFKQPDRLFKTQQESETIKEFCAVNNSVEIKSINGDENFNYCLVKTCNNNEYYNEVSKSCATLQNSLKFEMKINAWDTNLDIQPISAICEYLNEHFAKFPDCTRSETDIFGWPYSNYGFYYPKYYHPNSYTFQVNSNKDTKYIIVTFLFNTKSTEQKNDLKTFIQYDFWSKFKSYSSSYNITETLVIEDWIIENDSNKNILITKNTTFTPVLYQLTNWQIKISNQSQYPINCKLSIYAIFRSNDLSNNEIVQLMSLKLKVQKEDILSYDKVNNKLKHYHCPISEYKYVYANSIFSDINAWINIIVIPISIGGLTCTCFTYISFKKLRNLSGICATNLSVCLLLNYVLFFTLSLLKEARAGKLGCKIGAVLNHFSAVSVFTWSCCTAFEAYSMITRKSASGSGGRTRIIAVFVIGYTVPLIFVLTCMSVWLGCGTNCSIQIGYTDPNTGLCWLRSGISVMVGMTVPAILSCLTSISFLAMTIRDIVNVMKQTTAVLSSNSGKNHRKLTVIITIKLAILLGLAWIFPSINIAARSNAFDVFCNLFIASQGLMVSFCFLSTPKIRKLYRNSTFVSTIIKRGQTIISRDSNSSSEKMSNTSKTNLVNTD